MYRWLDNTAELELELEADTEAGLFEQAVGALRELLDPEGSAGSGEEVTVPVQAGAADLPALLAAWVEELVYLADTTALVPERASDVAIAAGSVNGTVHGRRGSPRPLVKAVTYHRLAAWRENSRWHARMVLDV